MEQMIDVGGEYRSGVCNIGPAEIAARRRAGDIGVAATAGILGALILVGADPWWRAAIFFPAAVAASGYLQATMHFCANYGWRGVFNLGDELRDTTTITDQEAAAADRRTALRIGLLSALGGGVVAGVAVLLPV